MRAIIQSRICYRAFYAITGACQTGVDTMHRYYTLADVPDAATLPRDAVVSVAGSIYTRAELEAAQAVAKFLATKK